jgi:hypothetical protein
MINSYDVLQQYLGFLAVIYLNRFARNDLTNAPDGLAQSMAAGIRVQLHNPGTIPDMKYAKTIGPGSEATITMQATTRQRLGQPWGNCTYKTYLGEATDSAYSFGACEEVCLQKQVRIAGISLLWTQMQRADFSMIFTVAQFGLHLQQITSGLR